MVASGEHLDDGLARLLELTPDAMVIVDSLGEMMVVNAQFERLFGYRREELVGERIELLVPERFREHHSALRADYSVNPHARPMGAGLALFGRRRDGTEFPVEISLGPLETEQGPVVVSAIRDVSDRIRVEQDASHFAAVVESSNDAIIGMDLDGSITSWNTGAERLYGYSADEAMGKSVSVLAPPGHDDELPEILRCVRAGERVDDYEAVSVCKDGTLVDVSLTVSPIRDRSGAVVGASTIARDISARLRYQRQLVFLAEHDALTGARNRHRFQRDISEQVGRARRYGEKAALLVIDVNDFKQINDTHGHGVGDKALQAIAAALRNRVRETDMVARLGGDEFAVLIPYADLAQTTALAADLRRLISECKIETSDHSDPRLSASIGIVQIDQNTPSDEAVLLEADKAMYADKRRAHTPPSRTPRHDPSP